MFSCCSGKSVRGTWYVVRGTWCVVRGTWYVVRGTWLSRCDLRTTHYAPRTFYLRPHDLRPQKIMCAPRARCVGWRLQ
ncbi:MAG: hypothetical protein DMD54_16945 [Gemmatimonadetes bacterium]|nr:MAG: hypothetical protein DMD54_16945 [Gemmatimonadota bacterium]